MSRHVPSSSAPSRARLLAITAGGVGSLALASSMGATLSGLTATIANTTNSTVSATIAVREENGTHTCNSYDSAAQCSTINKYGGTGAPLVPGRSVTRSILFTNVGTGVVERSSLTAGACSATSSGAAGSTRPSEDPSASDNLCSVLQVRLFEGTSAAGKTPLYSGSAAGFRTVELGQIPVKRNQAYTFVVELPSGSTPAIQGQHIAQELTWDFSQ